VVFANILPVVRITKIDDHRKVARSKNKNFTQRSCSSPASAGALQATCFFFAASCKDATSMFPSLAWARERNVYVSLATASSA
jgi:hypothetical protein